MNVLKKYMVKIIPCECINLGIDDVVIKIIIKKT